MSGSFPDKAEQDYIYDTGYKDGFANAETALRPLIDKCVNAILKLVLETERRGLSNRTVEEATALLGASDALRWVKEVLGEQVETTGAGEQARKG